MSLLSQKESLDLLSNPTRIQIIRALQANEGSLEVSELAENLAEHVHTLEDPARAKRRLLQTLLRTHIPKMEQMGLLKYEADNNTVTLKELPSPVATELESLMLLLFDLLRGGHQA